MQESAKGGTTSSSWTFVSGSTLTINIPAVSSAAFSLNNVYQKSLVSGFAVYSFNGSAVALNTLNVSSITYKAVGKSRINWAIPMATDYYACSCIGGADSNEPPICSVDFISPSRGMLRTSLDIVISNISRSDLDTDYIYVVCYGGAEATGLK